MKHNPVPGTRFFFATSPMPCPYLPGRVERRLVTELVGRDSGAFHDALSRVGFRRSHGIAYVTACPDCTACATVRVVVDGFRCSRSYRRILAINGDLRATETATEATEEQYDLFNRYQRSRHGGGEMSRMDYYDYQSLVEDTPVQSCLVEFRDANDTLLAACLIDHLSDGLSAVYSFFDPDQPRRSLGTLMVLWLVEEARRRRLPYVYLGFWIADCRKMAYKGRFQPLEAYTPDGWQRIDPDDPETTRHFCAGL